MVLVATVLCCAGWPRAWYAGATDGQDDVTLARCR
jgi:hypothetical protein